MSLLFSLFSTFRGGLSTVILFYRFNIVISRKFIRSYWLLAPEIISQERKERKKEKERKKTLPFRCWANELKVALGRHDIVPLVWDSDLAGNPNPFKTPNGSVRQRGEVVLVTASFGTSKFLGIPNLIYENRMPWANQWGLSSNVSFSTSPHSPCHPPAKFLSLTKSTSSCGQTSQATTTASTLCGNKIPILKEAFVQFLRLNDPTGST